MTAGDNVAYETPMGYVVDRVVICDAYTEPDKHYKLLSGGRSRLEEGRRPSMRFLASARDVKSVTHILGLRAFGSPLLTEQIIGRGLRRTNYDILNQPLEERPDGSDETVDAFGIPFIGFPVEKRKRPKTEIKGGTKVWIEGDPKKENYRIRIPNVCGAGG